MGQGLSSYLYHGNFLLQTF